MQEPCLPRFLNHPLDLTSEVALLSLLLATAYIALRPNSNDLQINQTSRTETGGVWRADRVSHGYETLKAQLVHRFMNPPVKLLLRSPMHRAMSSKRTEGLRWRDRSARARGNDRP